MTVTLATALFERLERRSVRDESTGCFLWLGAHTRGNYGVIRAVPGSREQTTVHRASWEALNGPVPEGLCLDHLCHSFDDTCPGGPACMHRRCWNETHLEPTTPKENSARGRPPVNKGPHYQASKTECVNQHPFDEANTYVDKQGHRHCRACDARQHRRARGVDW